MATRQRASLVRVSAMPLLRSIQKRFGVEFRIEMMNAGKSGLINWFSCSRDDLAQAVLRKGGASPGSSQLKRRQT
jgi:hypothetical protein